MENPLMGPCEERQITIGCSEWNSCEIPKVEGDVGFTRGTSKKGIG